MSATYFLEPLDVLLFRDGRPRVTGDSHVMTGTFPPPPSALYGAFRSALMAHGGARFRGGRAAPDLSDLPPDVAEAVGTPTATGALTLEQVQLARRDGDAVLPLYPAGADLVRPKVEERRDEILRLVPFSDEGRLRSSLPSGLHRVGVPGERAFLEAVTGYLEPSAFAAYLAGDVAGLPLHRAPVEGPDENADETKDAVFAIESRTSVMLDDATGTAAEDMLYTTDFTRLRCGYGLAVQVTHAETLGTQGVLRLGAEQRPVAYRRVEAPAIDPEPVLRGIDRHFRLVLVSPAPFTYGWRPDFIGDDLTGDLCGCRVRLIAAIVGRYEHIGGWDLVRGRPKPAVRAVPSGSVYFFELLDGEPDALRAAFGRSLFHAEDDRARHGLGIAYPGIV